VKKDASHVPGARAVILIKCRETEPPQVVEESITPRRLKGRIGVNVEYRDQLRPKSGLLIMLGSDAGSGKDMDRWITPE
jgi:hypothetical protein